MFLFSIFGTLRMLVRPAMKRLFCLKAKNGLGRFAPSALPHYDLWSVGRNRQEDLQYNIYSAGEKHICHILPPLLQGITNLFDYSTNRNFIVLSCLQWAGGEERGHNEEGGLWRGRPAQTHH